MADLTRVELHHLALLGAKARLGELREEQAAILKAFPGLSTGRNAHHVAAASVDAPVRRRKGMSAAARKEVSARMKKYWAARRKEKAARTAK